LMEADFSLETWMFVLDGVETQWLYNLIQAHVEAGFLTVGPLLYRTISVSATAWL
jgi:hypothetical protein